MLTILEFVFFLLFLPSFLFGFLLVHLGQMVASVFEPRLLMASVWCAAVGSYLDWHSGANDDSPYLTLVQSLAKTHIGPEPMPAAMLWLAGLLILAAPVVAMSRRQARL